MVLWSPVCEWGSSDKSSVCADAALIEVPVSKQQINSAFLTLTPSVPQHLSFPPARKNNKVCHGYVEIWNMKKAERVVQHPLSHQMFAGFCSSLCSFRVPRKDAYILVGKWVIDNSLVNASAVWASTQGLRVVVIFFTHFSCNALFSPWLLCSRWTLGIAVSYLSVSLLMSRSMQSGQSGLWWLRSSRFSLRRFPFIHWCCAHSPGTPPCPSPCLGRQLSIHWERRADAPPVDLQAAGWSHQGRGGRITLCVCVAVLQ